MTNQVISANEKAEELMKQGYLRISRKSCILSRIDRMDWQDKMALDYAPWDKEEGLQWVRSSGEINAEDYYRRCISKDKIVVPKEVSEKVATSNSRRTGYIEQEVD